MINQPQLSGKPGQAPIRLLQQVTTRNERALPLSLTRDTTTQDPKILATPATAYINQPAAADIELAT